MRDRLRMPPTAMEHPKLAAVSWGDGRVPHVAPRSAHEGGRRGLGSLATAPSVRGWHADAEKPWFNPPNWLFGPVWTVLYVVMAIAAWLIWLRRADRTRAVEGALRVWWAQLAANLAWTPTFFAAQWLWPALAVIVVLAVLVGG